jgi:MinD-like ATPase involved in chromosome partitioning or flagellar assembly
MKTFSFFTQKGGCGKTTLTILLAAYLRFKKGKTVKVIDYEANRFPNQRFRKNDLAACHQEGTALSNYLKGREVLEPYPIDVAGKEVNTYKAEDVIKLANDVNEEIRQDKYDYLILDFSAGYSRYTPVSCLVHNHLLDGVYIPTSTESQERLDAINLGRHFLEEEQPFRIVWNRIKRKFIENPDLLNPAEQQFLDLGLACSEVRIKDFNKATEDSDVRCFVRNTLCWPERYVQMFCPELIDLFEEIITFLGD